MVFTDSFTGANDDPLNANWTVDQGTLRIFVNCCNENALAFPHIGRYAGGMFANDQYAQVKPFNGVGIHGGGVAVRLDASKNGYCAYFVNPTTVLIDRIDAGALTNLASIGSLSFTADVDVLKLDVVGTTLTAYKNGTPIGNATDSTHASGRAGVVIQGNSGTLIDDWEGGDIGGGGQSPAMTSVPFVPRSMARLRG
jgi:hypothetical protein